MLNRNLIALALVSITSLTGCEKEDLAHDSGLKYEKCTAYRMNAQTGTADRTLAAPGDVKPIFERDLSCYDAPNHSCRLVYSYNNTSGTTQYIPYGSANEFVNPNGSTCQGNCGQPQNFIPGMQKAIFSLYTTEFGAKEHVWKLDGNTAAGVCNPSLNACNFGGSLPVKFTSVSAKFNGMNAVNVKWSFAEQVNVKEYRVQMSARCGTIADVIVAVVPAIGSSAGTYTSPAIYLDQGGDYQFRVVAIDLDGKTTYSNVMSVRVGN